MGTTFAVARVTNPRIARAKGQDIEFLVDTGALYSVLPASKLKKLRVRSLGDETFTLADGTHQTFAVGEAFFSVMGRGATSKVVFGPEESTPLLGALTLESLGLMVNPVTREVKPMRLLLAGFSSGAMTFKTGG